jgi:hypothetical protein
MNHSNSFELITGDEILISEVVDYFNAKYGRDFKITGYDNRDGVIFAKIAYEKSTLNDVFQLGSIFGMRIQYKRDKGELDW